MTIEQDNKWAQKFPNGEFYAYFGGTNDLSCIGHFPRKPIPSRYDEGCHIILQTTNNRGVERSFFFPRPRNTMPGFRSFKTMEDFLRGCTKMGISQKMVEVFKAQIGVPMPKVSRITFGW